MLECAWIQMRQKKNKKTSAKWIMNLSAIQEHWSCYCKICQGGELFPNSLYANQVKQTHTHARTPSSTQPPTHTSATKELRKSFNDRHVHTRDLVSAVCQLMLPSGQEKGRIDCNSSSSDLQKQDAVLAVLSKISPQRTSYCACIIMRKPNG